MVSERHPQVIAVIGAGTMGAGITQLAASHDCMVHLIDINREVLQRGLDGIKKNLDSLVEKGFAQVVQERTKLFSAVEPDLAIPSYLARKRHLLEHELTDQTRAAAAIADDLKEMYSSGQGGRGTLDYLRIVSEPAQTAAEYRRMLSEVKLERSEERRVGKECRL